jgi:hypothetical protein
LLIDLMAFVLRAVSRANTVYGVRACVAVLDRKESELIAFDGQQVFLRDVCKSCMAGLL